MRHFKQKARGFTLIELAISLLIIGLVVGTLILPVAGQFNFRSIDDTQKIMENVKEALIGYAVVNSFLPCPASVVSNPAVNDQGKADSTLCNQEGFLPWAELGIGKVTDGWGMPIRYRVDLAYTTTFPTNVKTSSGLSVTHDYIQSDGSILNTPLASLEADNSSKIVAVLLSYGNDKSPNGTLTQQSTSATPYENGDGNVTYVFDDYQNGSDATKNFDDIVVWLPKTTLLARLAAANRYPFSSP